MGHNFDKGIILSGNNFAWLHYKDGETIKEVVFDNLQSSNYKIKSLEAAGGGENIDITRADGAIIRFDKRSLILKGETGEDITPADEASSKGEITLVINEAPTINGTASGWTAFIKFLQDNQNKEFLVTIGTGHTHKSRISATRKPDGFAYMIGKINNDIEQNLDSNSGSITLTFVGKENSAFAEDDLAGVTTLYSAVTDLRGGVGKDVADIKPITITEAMEGIILSGEIALAITA